MKRLYLEENTSFAALYRNYKVPECTEVRMTPEVARVFEQIAGVPTCFGYYNTKSLADNCQKDIGPYINRMLYVGLATDDFRDLMSTVAELALYAQVTVKRIRYADVKEE